MSKKLKIISLISAFFAISGLAGVGFWLANKDVFADSLFVKNKNGQVKNLQLKEKNNNTDQFTNLITEKTNLTGSSQNLEQSSKSALVSDSLTSTDTQANTIFSTPKEKKFLTQFLNDEEENVDPAKITITKNDVAVFFIGNQIAPIRTLNEVIADQNAEKYFAIKKMSKNANYFDYKLKMKPISDFANFTLDNFKLSWEVKVYNKNSSEVKQTLTFDDVPYSQNLIFLNTENSNTTLLDKTIFSNNKNSTYKQYYNPSIWYLGNNTYFARADANSGNNYELENNQVVQVESWSYDGGKTWTTPKVFMKIVSKTGFNASVGKGITFFDKQQNKLFFIADFWGGNLGSINKGDSGFALSPNDSLWRVWKSGETSKQRVLILEDDSDFTTAQTLYYRVYKRKNSAVLPIDETKKMYSENQKSSQITSLTSKYDAENVWVELKYDPTTGDFSSKVATDASNLSAAKTKFTNVTSYIFEGSSTSTKANGFSSGSYVTASGPIVFTFEKDLNDPIGLRKWKLISKYPENYNFAAKGSDGKITSAKNQYLQLNPGNGVVLPSGIYGVVFSYTKKNPSRSFSGAQPNLVTGKYDVANSRINWTNQSFVKQDNQDKLFYTQITDGSNYEDKNFAYLATYSGEDKGLVFYKSGNVNLQTGAAMALQGEVNFASDNKNSLQYPIYFKNFNPSFAGFKDAQKNAWFVVAGPSNSKDSGTTYDQDGILLLANHDFTKVYQIGFIPGGFQNSVINIVKSDYNKDITSLTFVVAYESKDSSKNTQINLKKYALDLALTKFN